MNPNKIAYTREELETKLTAAQNDAIRMAVLLNSGEISKDDQNYRTAAYNLKFRQVAMDLCGANGITYKNYDQIGTQIRVY